MYRVPVKKKLKKLAPSRKPTAFDPARVVSLNSRSGSSGASALVSMTRKAASRAAEAASSARVLAAGPPGGRRLRDRVDQHHQGAGHRDGAERVVGPAGACQPAFRDGPPGQEQSDRADRDVQVEDVLPAGVPDKQAAGQQADGRGRGADATPGAECLVALGALAEHVHTIDSRARPPRGRPAPQSAGTIRVSSPR
jgi:hypothetical protein